MALNRKKKILLFSSATLVTIAIVFISAVDISAANLQQKYVKPTIKHPLLNKTDTRRVLLGKTLFFDPRLSGSNWISCGTCHNPAMGWTDGLKTAIGEGQKRLKRATPTILNTAYNGLQMWDGRFRSLEQQALGPIEAKDEMNQDLDELIVELDGIPGYVELFADAYPGRGINRKTIAMAIAAFERSVVTNEAPFDKWVAGDAQAISKAAKRGFKIFEGKGRCSTCHEGYKFSDDGFHNIGLKSKDPGRFAIKPLEIARGAFKTPTLRDIVKTAPYMHDGAYNTLEEVIDHYSRGGDDKSNLSPNMKAIKLTDIETQDLVEFLKTLTGDEEPIQVPVLPFGMKS